MKLLGMLLRRDTAFPIFALAFATVASVALVIARMAWTGNLRYAFLIWNLFLAWMPLVFALLVYRHAEEVAPRRLTLVGLGTTWLLFFPNAPYIFTDLIHLTVRFSREFWLDLVLILICAITGFILGFVSLYLMQSVVRQHAGRLASWVFIAGVAGLTGFGIYLGRFLRFNSWDVVLKPLELSREIGAIAAAPLSQPFSFAFPALFAAFLFISYLMLYALTHLNRLELPKTQELA